jgi:hypothetical protein
MTDTHSGDHWKNLAHRDTSDAEAFAAGSSLDPEGPAAAGMAFITALSQYDVRTLRAITSPDSGWGDFRAAHDLLEAIPDWGVGSVANYAVDRDDVAYMKILGNVTHNMQATEEDIVGAAAILTLINPGTGWIAHAIGNDYWTP